MYKKKTISLLFFQLFFCFNALFAQKDTVALDSIRRSDGSNNKDLIDVYHHIFNSIDLKEIKKHFEKIVSANKIIITTEKDAVRLQKFETELAHLPIFVLPIKQHFLFGEADAFNILITNFISSFNKPLLQV